MGVETAICTIILVCIKSIFIEKIHFYNIFVLKLGIFFDKQ